MDCDELPDKPDTDDASGPGGIADEEDPGEPPDLAIESGSAAGDLEGEEGDDEDGDDDDDDGAYYKQDATCE